MRPEKRSNIGPGMVVTAGCIALVLLVSCATKKGITLFKLVPVKGQVSSASISEGKIILSARYLDAGERAMYFREMGFETLGQGLLRVPMTSFLLNLENRSNQDLILDPSSIRFASGYGPMLSPYNYAHLYMQLPQGSDRQRILLDLRKAIYDKTTTLAPGQTSGKLLLFDRPEKVGPVANITFNRLYVGGKEHQVALEFVAVDLEE
ncbi:MAG: hypothetical protein PVJ01_00080 [Pseudomonadota bacterium]|jgi:hypothetical protein